VLELELTSSVFHDFVLVGEPVVVFNNGIYTPSFSDNADFIRIHGRKKSIEKVMGVVDSERMFFDRNRKTIEDYFGFNFNSGFFQYFVENFVFKEYFEMPGNGNSTVNSSKKGYSLFEELVSRFSKGIKINVFGGGHDFAFLNGDVFALQPKISASFNCVSLGGNSYFLKKAFSAERFEELYHSRIKGRVDLFKNRVSSTKISNGRELGSVGYNISGGKCVVYTIIPEFIMKYKGRNYHFESLRVGLELNVNDSVLSMKSAPRVLDDSYKHPFVFTGGDICYGDGWRWDKVGVVFGDYNVRDVVKRNVAKQIVTMLTKAKDIIMIGYYGNVRNPVKRIDGGEMSQRFVDSFSANRMVGKGVELVDCRQIEERGLHGPI